MGMDNNIKIGVFGGTFDPIHNGHLAIAEEVKAQLNLTEIRFVPAGQPWLKAGRTISSREQRVQMVELAIAGKSYFKLSKLEVAKPGPSYTIDTMADIKRQSKGAELFFIMGWDSLNSLPLWKESLRLIKICRLVAIPRPGSPQPDLAALEKGIPGLLKNLVMLDKPEIDISATEIRARVAKGLPIDWMVPETVAQYIKQNRLYLEV
jgi:nicotinate-nucleotide adenylyltransferase